ncbi:DUF862-domain-containing protein [Acaromyces ingoldii]|uniref:DUF862-domain-containing protein n=1 Tax=Acaromyces ingoldii TaxID=215250 RepID=A0A316YXB7_9BASI|nr:DUF862-domain-containing protein [Acaromyces ingoldii]PWN94097.1 DUF862-domain-containing protein [Acaromyces ingoldii]
MGEEEQYPVELYVYDLSNGLARGLSQQLTGRQFDAIYHTSIVVHNIEWFYGQGIANAAPGRTHHGSPIEQIPLGTTSIDRDTIKEIIGHLSDTYTAQAYHLLNFNCNTFSNELSNILVGQNIPERITNLPQDFLSTPFGQMMAPQIDAMFRGPAQQPAMGAGPSAPANPAAAGILNHVAQSAYKHPPQQSSQNGNKQPTFQRISTVSQLKTVTQNTPCAVVLFTAPETCPPCRVLQPIFEEVTDKYVSARDGRNIAFAVVDSSPLSAGLMSERKIHATPTLQFFVHGSQIDEVKGAPGRQKLEDSIESTLWQVYRPHPHSKLAGPESRVPSQAILFKNAPNYTAAVAKLDEALSTYKAKSFDEKADLQEARAALVKTLVASLKDARALNEEEVDKSAKAIETLLGKIDISKVFPAVDFLRVAILDPSFCAKLASRRKAVVSALLDKVRETMEQGATMRATLLTTYRFIGNALASDSIAPLLKGEALMPLLVFGLLHDDANVRGGAVSATFNLALDVSRRRRGSTFVRTDGSTADVDAGLRTDEEVELVCALLESAEKEADEEKLHRSSAALNLLLYLSPSWNASLGSLMDVLEAGPKLRTKAAGLAKQAAGDVEARKKREDVKALLETCAKLCEAQPPS